GSRPHGAHRSEPERSNRERRAGPWDMAGNLPLGTSPRATSPAHNGASAWGIMLANCDTPMALSPPDLIMHMCRLLPLLTLGFLLQISAASARAGDKDGVSFGFTGPETFPIDNFVGDLHAADIDGDGLNDIVVVNNARSKINILYNQTGKTNRVEPKKVGKQELNELPPDARFRIDSIASEK